MLVSNPKYLILDEPFASLDYDGKKQLIKILNDLHLKSTTIIIISYSSDIICELVDRVIVLDDGKIITDGKAINVISNSKISKLSKKLHINNCVKYEDSLNENGYLNIAHGMSREKINKHHEGKASDYSRDLLSGQELAFIMNKYLDVELIIDNDKYYHVLGCKRS